MTKSARPREAVVLREIELALGAEPDLLLLRNSCGVAREVDENGNTRFVRFGLGPGSPDLVGILAPAARVVALEVKRRGEHATPEQLAVHRIWKSYGAYVATVHSVDEARAALHQARKENLSMSYVIHGRTFANRREVAIYLQSLLNRGGFSRVDEEFLRELLTGHPRYSDIVGRGIQRIVVEKNGFNEPWFVVERVDGSRCGFSYLSCLTKKFAVDTSHEAA